MDETHDLVRRAQSGEAARFGDLYERMAPALFTWAEIRIRPEMRAFLEPADVVQEVWCRAWRSFRTFDAERTAFRYWIFRIAKNVLLEALRELRSPKHGRSEGESSRRLFDLVDVPDTATSISQRLARDENLARFAQWVSLLEEEDRMLVVHVGLEGLSHAEAAERMQLSRDAVAKRWQRLMVRTQEALPSQGLLADPSG